MSRPLDLSRNIEHHQTVGFRQGSHVMQQQLQSIVTEFGQSCRALDWETRRGNIIVHFHGRRASSGAVLLVLNADRCRLL